jgi:hypothetical protein
MPDREIKIITTPTPKVRKEAILPSRTPASAPKIKNQKKLILFGALLIAVLLIIIGFLFIKYNKASNDPQSAAKATTKRIVERVGSIYDLPTDEEPTVAQVQDKAKLQGQVFFAKAQNGDYILVYSKNKLAMIYREKDGKLINVGPINIDDSQQSAQPGQTTPNPQPSGTQGATTKPGN